MSRKIKTKIYRKREFIEFLANCKNAIIEKETGKGKTIRIDTVTLITKTGDFKAGELINTVDEKYSINTVASNNCNYTILKKSTILTETNIDIYENLFIYEGNTNDERISKILGIGKNDKLEIYNDPVLFIKEAINSNITYNIGDNKYVKKVTNEVIYGNESSIYIGECDITVTRDEIKGIVREQKGNPTLLLTNNNDIGIRQTTTMSDTDMQEVKYLLYTRE